MSSPAVGIVFDQLRRAADPRTGRSTMSVAELVEATGYTRRWVQKAIGTLRDEGLITDGRHLGGGKYERSIPLPFVLSAHGYDPYEPIVTHSFPGPETHLGPTPESEVFTPEQC